MISRLLLVLALAVLAYIVYITMTTDTFANSMSNMKSRLSINNNKQQLSNQMPQPILRREPMVNKQHMVNKEHMINKEPHQIVLTPQINYEAFENAPGQVEIVPDANPAPFKDNKPEDDGLYARVKYSGLVDANPNDSLQIEGTDLLTAPLVDNMLYTNSISNVNRNASNDLRGDISVQFDKNYTPFYTSTIAGVDRLGGTMNIGRATSKATV